MNKIMQKIPLQIITFGFKKNTVSIFHVIENPIFAWLYKLDKIQKIYSKSNNENSDYNIYLQLNGTDSITLLPDIYFISKFI